MIGVTPLVTNISQTAVTRLEPKKRDCYMDNEFDIDPQFRRLLGWIYSMTNCAYIEGIKFINKQCNCTSYFAHEKMMSQDFCRGKKLFCKMPIARGLFNLPSSSERKKCLPSCQREEYMSSQTSTAYPKKQVFTQRKDICFIFKKLVKICDHPFKAITFEAAYKDFMTCSQIKNADDKKICNDNKFDGTVDTGLEMAILTYARENIAYIKVFIKEPYYTLTTHDVQISVSQFIGNLGGLLGGLLGLSAVSIMEIMFFMVLFFQSLAISKGWLSQRFLE